MKKNKILKRALQNAITKIDQDIFFHGLKMADIKDNETYCEMLYRQYIEKAKEQLKKEKNYRKSKGL